MVFEKKELHGGGTGVSETKRSREAELRQWMKKISV
jgi:hypothetical protein